MTNEDSSNENKMKKESPLGVPVAIVIAGALIAVALFFGSGRTVEAPNDLGGTDSGLAGIADNNDEVAGESAVAAAREVSDDDHIRGATNAKVTLIEYSDIECPFCKRFHPTVQQILDEYPNDVRWVYRHFPLEQLHPNARMAANAAECAGEQGKFWEMLDDMFESANTGADLAAAKLPGFAQNVGVGNMSQFQSCLDAGKYDDRIDADLADANAAGGQGTPYTILVGPNGEREAISGAQPYASVKAAVDKYL